jgi:hypothetical protein
MTEDEWLVGSDPRPMLEFLRGRADERKLRLFAAACCRAIWGLLDPGTRAAVVVAERFADGAAEEAERRSAHEAIPRLCHGEDVTDPANVAAFAAEAAACAAFGRDDYPPIPTYATTCAIAAACASADAAAFAAGASAEGGEKVAEEIADWVYAEGLRHCSGLVRDLFGDPFRPVVVEPGWLTPEAVDLARSMYDTRAFDRLPELADVLAAAGCAEGRILDHCRTQRDHVRGCWVVDAILGMG